MEIFVTRLQDYLREVAEFSRLCYNKVTQSTSIKYLRDLEPTEEAGSPERQKKPKTGDVCTESLVSDPLPSFSLESSEKSVPVVSVFVLNPEVSPGLQEKMLLYDEELVQQKPGPTARIQKAGRKRRKRDRSTKETPPDKPIKTEEQKAKILSRIQTLKNEIEELAPGLERLPELALALWNKGKALYREHISVLVTIQHRFQELKCDLEDWEPLFEMVWAHILPSILRDLKNYNQETCYKQFNFKKDTWQYLSELNYQAFKSRVSALEPQPFQVFLCETLFDALRSVSQTLRFNLQGCFNATNLDPLPQDLKEIIRCIVDSKFALKAYQKVCPDLTRTQLCDLVEICLETARILQFSNTGFHGLTLVTKTMLLDHLKPPKCPQELEFGAILVFFLHELGHIVVRQSVTTLSECIDTYTPLKSTTNYPKIGNPSIPRDEDNLQFSEEIDSFLPHHAHLEAGDQVELFLFGEKLGHLALEGYNFMIDHDNWTTGFKTRFREKNLRPKNATPETYLSLARTRGENSVDCIDLTKGCRYSFYGTYL